MKHELTTKNSINLIISKDKMTVTKEECQKPRLGYYQLEKALGAGNFAVVRLAVHCITGTKVRNKTFKIILCI